MHLILRSGRHDLRKNERLVVYHWHRLAKAAGIRTYQLAVVSDHVHALVRVHSRGQYRRFISGFTGLISKLFQIQGRTLPATRLAEWGRGYETLRKYVQLNEWEAAGYIDYLPERTRNTPEWLKL
ncbi:MAG: transposase [Bdellovibrionales bacterium]